LHKPGRAAVSPRINHCFKGGFQARALKNKGKKAKSNPGFGRLTFFHPQNESGTADQDLPHVGLGSANLDINFPPFNASENPSPVVW